MANYNGGLGVGTAYQEGVTGGLRYGFMTNDAFNPIAAAPVRAVGPSPIPVVAGGVNLVQSANDGQSSGIFGGSPWSLSSSMVPYLLIGGVGAILFIHFVHFN